MFSPDKWLANASTGFYGHTIDKSLRYNSADTLAMKRTPSSAGNRQTWSVSVWVKRSKLGVSQQQLLEAGSSGGYASRLFWYFDSNDKLALSSGDVNYGSGGRVLRDVSSWYHILIRCTGGSVTHFVNGVLDKTQSLSGDTAINSTVQHGFGTRGASGAADEFDGYLAQYALFDGTAYTYDQVTETKDGILVPKNLSSLSYGTNGFLLDFANSGAVGTDAVGSNNMDTVSGFVASDVMTGESPTNNFCTLNPLSKGSGTITFSEGNLKSSSSANLDAAEHGATFTIPKSGKWYWEASYTGAYTGGAQATIMGIMDIDTQTVGQSGNHITNTTGEYVTYYSHNNGVYVSNSLTDYTGQITTQTDATVGFVLDMDNGHLWIHVNGTYINGTPDFSDGTNKIASPTTTKTFLPFFGGAGGAAFTWRANFGQDSEGISSAQSPDDGIGTFEYDVPADYKALCSANLPEPEIIDGSEHFNTVLWTGDAAQTRSLSGLGFQPDFSWLKIRSGTAQDHQLYDSVRGAGSGKNLSSNTTAVEGTVNSYPDGDYGFVSSFDSDGFSVDDGAIATTGGYVNYSGRTYVAWNWKAGTAFSNNAGANGANVDSSGQVNTKAGFSIVSWQYTTSADNLIAHGLSFAPEMMILKSRTTAYNWDVYHTALSAASKRFILNGTSTSTGAGGELAGFFDTAPTDTLFEYNTSAATNNDNMIAYCFHSVEGYSKIGTYSGNNSADGPFVYTGFRPAWVLIKLYSAAGQWWGIYDSARDPDNLVTQRLWWNASNVESAYSTDELDFLSNGFKPRGNYSSINASYNYLYLAFAEQPFKFANAR